VAGNEPPLNYDEHFLRRSNVRRRVEISVPTFSMAPQLVVGTDRVTTITTRLATKYAEILPLRLLPLPIAMPPMVEMLQWHKIHENDPAHQWFRALLNTAVQRLPSPPEVLRRPRAARVSGRS
jgi:LysR family transcriptional regulator, nod-box dependent transcriptional activator